MPRGDVVEEALEHRGVVDGLGHHQLGAGLDLLLQPRDLPRVVHRRGLGAGGEQKLRRAAEGLAPRVAPVVQPAHHAQSPMESRS
jgi:hypothetical protein